MYWAFFKWRQSKSLPQDLGKKFVPAAGISKYLTKYFFSYHLIRIKVILVMNQKELAEILGVSQATVSLALAGDARVNAATKRKICAVARKLGYVPNASARALVRKRTETIGVVVLGLSKDNMRSELFFSDAILTIALELGNLGYNILLKVEELIGKEEFLTDLAREKRVDGLIILTLAPFYREFLGGLEEMDFPFVLVNRHLGEYPVNCVVLDDYGATYQAVEYLYGLGHRQLVYLAGDDQCSALADRAYGFRAAVRDYALAESVNRVISFTDGNRENLVTYLNQYGPPTGVIAYNDVRALEAKQILAEFKLSPPVDYSLIGFDNRFTIFSEEISLTTFDYSLAEMGQKAVRLLLDVMKGKTVEREKIMVTPCFLERRSCGPPPLKVTSN